MIGNIINIADLWPTHQVLLFGMRSISGILRSGNYVCDDIGAWYLDTVYSTARLQMPFRYYSMGFNWIEDA